jgi:hypothetical protein
MKVLNLLIVCGVCILSGCATPTPTRARWEYKTIKWNSSFEGAEVQLNELAKDGWIVVDHSFVAPDYGWTFVLKRPLK